MPSKGVKRKISAVLSADAVGYSKLMEADEVVTIQTMESYRDTIFSIIQQHNGRVVDSPGDNILSEFLSVVESVQCAVEIQHVIKAKNAVIPEARRMDFRIGIHLGDVIEEKERIYGDGVNIAARIEGLADAGGICISNSAYEQIKSKLALGYEDIGEHSVKNISEPIRVFRIPLDSAGGSAGIVKGEPKRYQWVALALVCIVIGAGVIIAWNQTQKARKATATAKEESSPIPPFQAANPVAAEKPSIAVLPFDNMSGDPKDAYLSNAMTAATVTGLTRVSSLRVISHYSALAFRDRSLALKEVGKELGVAYMLQGGIQKINNRLRITSQLVDSADCSTLWSENYDRNLDDLFAIQDDITREIMTAVQVKLVHGEEARAWEKGTDNPRAYLKFLQAFGYWEPFKSQDLALAWEPIEEAIALDPEFAAAHALHGFIYHNDAFLGQASSIDESRRNAERLAYKALSLNDSEYLAHCLLGWVLLAKGEYDAAVAECEKAVAIDPNTAFSHAALGVAFYNSARYEEAISALEKAIRLSPFPPGWYLTNLGLAKWMLGHYEEALSLGKRVELDPRRLGSEGAHLVSILAYMSMGREKEARNEAKKLLKSSPDFSVEKRLGSLLFKDKKVSERVRDSLERAGL